MNDRDIQQVRVTQAQQQAHLEPLYASFGFRSAGGRFWEAAEAIFAAYFTEGRDVGGAEVLAEVAASAGLDADEARAVLARYAVGAVELVPV